MGDHSDADERSLALAEAALNRIKALGLAADPRNFEFFYAYAGGYNAELNRALDELSAERQPSQRDISRLYDRYLSQVRFSERIDEVGGKIMGEIDQVMSMIDAAIGSTDSYRQSLAGAETIPDDADRDQLRLIVETLVRSTKEVEITNQALQKRLVDTREEIRQLQENLEVVRTEALTDPLTSLANRKYLEGAITRLIADAENHGTSLAVILVDIDHFKRINDTYGHLTGDQVLRLVAITLKDNLKGQDVAARYGGEEFAVLLPRTTLRHGVTVAEHLRRAIMGKELVRRSTGETLGRVTISLGVAGWRNGDSAASLLERADNCLYAAKGSGRNCVIDEAIFQSLSQRVA